MSLIEKLLDALNMTGEVNSTASVIVSIGVILICGFLMTRLTKLFKLPNVTAYLIAGIVIGPSMINVVPQQFIDSTSFLGDIALAFIAFSVGEYFKIKEIKKVGPKIVVITIIETLLAFILTFVVCYFLIRLDFAFEASGCGRDSRDLGRILADGLGVQRTIVRRVVTCIPPRREVYRRNQGRMARKSGVLRKIFQQF